jgi:hypothetical protein
LYSFLRVTRIIRSRKKIGGTSSTNSEEEEEEEDRKRNRYRLSVGKEGLMDLAQIEWGDVDWIGVDEDIGK